MLQGGLVDILINITCALFGAILGSYAGYKYTVKLSNDKTENQRNALFNEISIINDDFVDWFKALTDEYNTPLRKSYSGPPLIYTQLIENLIVELSGTNRLLSLDQRRFLIGLKNKNEALLKKDKERDVHSNRWLLESNKLTKLNKLKIKQSIEFWTAHLLQESIDLAFYTAKYLDCKENFIFGEYSMNDKIIELCRYADINYNQDFWNGVIRRCSAA